MGQTKAKAKARTTTTTTNTGAAAPGWGVRARLAVRRAVAALAARLAIAVPALLARLVEGLESPTADGSLARAGRRLGAALRWSEVRLKAATRWARQHDTVPAAVVERLHQQSEERIRTLEISRERRQQRRQAKLADRRRRERQYGDKSSIYLG
jgi:hypothetical protein